MLDNKLNKTNNCYEHLESEAKLELAGRLLD